MGVHIGVEKQESYVVMKKIEVDLVYIISTFGSNHITLFQWCPPEECICVPLDPPHISLLLHPYTSCINLQ